MSHPLLGLFDVNEDGFIDVNEFQALLKYVKQWRDTFVIFDVDKTGYINFLQLFRTLKVCSFLSTSNSCTLSIPFSLCISLIKLSPLINYLRDISKILSLFAIKFCVMLKVFNHSLLYISKK